MAWEAGGGVAAMRPVCADADALQEGGAPRRRHGGGARQRRSGAQEEPRPEALVAGGVAPGPGGGAGTRQGARIAEV